MGKVVANEIKRLIQNRFIRLAVIVIVFMPLLYSFLYLYAFWDPYGKLDKLPIAVVNQDKDVIYNGKSANFGVDIIKELKKSKDFKWSFVSYSNGIDGLKGNKYYFMIVIPENFTKNILSVDSSNIKKAHIQYITNDKKNFLATQLGNKAIENITQKISNTIRKGYIDTVFTNIKDMGNGLRLASDAENELSLGTEKINDGMKKLNNGIESALIGSNQLRDGLYNIKNGTQNAANGASNLYNGAGLLSEKLDEVSKSSYLLTNGISDLNKGLNGVNQGLNTIKQSIDNLKNGVATVSEGYNQIGGKISSFSNNVVTMGNGISSITSALNNAQIAMNDYAKKHPDAMNDTDFKQAILEISQSNIGLKQISTNLNNNMPDITKLNNSLAELNKATGDIKNGFDKLSSGISQLQLVSSQLKDGGNNLNEGFSQYSGGIALINQKMKEVSGGLGELNSGLKSLDDGTQKLYYGAIKLNDGLATLSNGGNNLKDNMQKLNDSQQLLSKKLNDASNKIDLTSINDKKSNMINEPIVLDTRRLNPVANYGIGFAPYFIPLSLWVGALILFFLIDIFDRRGYAKESNASIIMGKFISLCILGILQSIVSSFVLIEVLKLPVNNLFYYYLINALMSAVFVAIIGFFVMLFGMAGKFLAIVLLMLQLTSSGGVFPMELVPRFFNIINPYFPMTYGTQALREAISGTNYSLMLNDLLILAGFGIVFMLLSVLLAEKVGDSNIIDEKLSL
ncbi:YhgE/Pip domain-containing protein [Thermoanaerobacterium sp. RBIITD]|uniref:YhgE/Pip domain-containing protein n=1 Tax=Thermoanaerobacterium sp. RBIITD TaxID=1550240 RepID=UPI000BB9827C|nr:YhgE/Pip domain-containing protein [Thermoanaerobacterium sp. RBIITD]SNX53444.1 putative membrane protein [Thermoanaerobacterium sp. RBIITD]